VYSDEDKVTPDGRHFDPYFKPGYSPEMLLSSMYLNHFTAMRTATVREVGGFRAGTDGAQDHDLAMRMVRAGAAVSHVPAVLYHWRAWSGSTAVGIQAKPWAQVAAADVQRVHLAAIGHPGVVEPSAVPGLNEVHPGITGEPSVSIVIPTISQRVAPDSELTLVEQCLRSIRQDGGWGNVELVVVHTNEPPRGQRELLEPLADKVMTYSTRQFNFSEACNLGAGAATGDYVLLLNDDTQILRAGSIRAMLEFAQLDGVGAVGARLTYPDGRNQHSGILFVDSQPTHPHHGAPSSEAGYFGSIITPRNYCAVTGAALMTPRGLFERLGGLDTGWPRDYQDVDYCLRLREAGYRIVYTPYAQFTHFESASLERSAPDPADTALFLARWGRGAVGIDPYYSPLFDQRISNLFSPR
jgi:GT2 family glycosyltransferase